MIRAKTFVICFLSFLTSETLGQEIDQARLIVSTSNNEVLRGVPVYLDFAIQNTSTADISGMVHQGLYQLTITTADYRTIRPPKLGSQPDVTGSFVESSNEILRKVSLKPGEMFQGRLLINRWYAFDVSGQFALEFQPNADFRTKEGRPVRMDASSIMFSVKEPTGNEITSLCERLSNLILQRSRLTAKQQSAIELSYIKDSKAIPFLEKVLQDADDDYDRYAIEGLVRIGSVEAIEVLLRNESREVGETRQFIRRVLRNIEQHSTDDELKRRIQAVP